MIDFATFFEELHSQKEGPEKKTITPFPWQTRLAKEVIEERRWPRVLDLPTSAGKTATIDIAVYALAAQAPPSREPRSAPLRMFFIIDRRIVVDEAFRRADRIASRLHAALKDMASPLHDIAYRLMQFGGLKPLHVSALRGGMYRDGSWAESPNQPTVCVSTVDQVGSRLLFRGYGVSEFARPIHAGLVGHDCLFLVDEAHLSRPFLETLRAIEDYQGSRWCAQPLSLPFHIVELSATPVERADVFSVDEADRQNELLNRRLAAHKQARLEEVDADPEDEDKSREEFAQAVARYALDFLAKNETKPKSAEGSKKKATKPKRGEPPAHAPPANIIGVVVNRVATARRVYDLLRDESQNPNRDVILLTGRLRPLDRDELLYRRPVHGHKGWFAFLKADKNRPKPARPVFVVATQTVEVGADVAFDALVTEAAPLDALRQRFGRLDRLGERGISDAIIVRRQYPVRGKDGKPKLEDDPIYGQAVSNTWKWLQKQQKKVGKEKVVDFGIDYLMPPTEPDELVKLCAPRPCAPVLLPSHLDILAQTHPTPHPDPDITLFLHGSAAGPPDVQIVWRADLPEELTRGDENRIISIVALVPPSSMEALPIPIYAAKAWLRRSLRISEVTDLEGAAADEGREGNRRSRLVLRWRGLDQSEIIGPDEIQPGDTLIVPAAYGGVDKESGCWNPKATDYVRDIGDHCAYYGRRRAVLRFHPAVIADWLWGGGNVPDLPRALNNLLKCSEGERVAAPSEVLQLLRQASQTLPNNYWLKLVAGVISASSPIEYPVEPQGDRAPFVLSSPRRIGSVRSTIQDCPDEDDFTSDDDASAITEVETDVTLPEHCTGVGKFAIGFSDGIGLPDLLKVAVARAALLHDAGKADERFQAWLCEGDEWRAVNQKLPLAKSHMSPRDRDAITRARIRAGYPEGGRHEYLSVLMLDEMCAALDGAADPDLIRWLVGTHHGRGRPFFERFDIPLKMVAEVELGNFTLRSTPAIRSARPPLERLDSGWVDLFWSLLRKYGWWGLAYLEAILRLADHRQSEQEREDQ